MEENKVNMQEQQEEITKKPWSSKKKIIAVCVGVVVLSVGVMSLGGVLPRKAMPARLELPQVGTMESMKDVSVQWDENTIFSDEKIKPGVQNATDYVYRFSNDQKVQERVNKFKEIFQNDDGKVREILGIISYSCSNENETEDINLNKEDGKKIALDFLKDNGLLADGFSGSNSSVGESTIKKLVVPPATSEPMIINLIVYFNREIDGKKVQGSHISVTVGAQGKIENVSLKYKLFAPEPEQVSIKSFEETLADVKQDKGTISLEWDAASVLLKEVSLQYYEEMNDRQTHIQPVYSFKGDCLDAQGNVIGEFNATVAAVRE